MIGSPRKLDWQAVGLAQPFWNNGEPYEEFPIDTARLSNVIELAAAKSGWGSFLPALTNAIFKATGKRIRNLPIGDQLRT